jgi:tetratricopeptide (TPR) repeat protein
MIIIPLLIVAVLCSLTLRGEIRGKVRILVTDIKGNPVPGVKITLVSQKSSVIRHEIFTNDKGLAIHGSLENHVFTFTFEKEGYLTQTKMIKIPLGLLQREEIVLRTQADVTLEIQASDPHGQAINLYNEAATFLQKEDYEKALELLKESIALDGSIHQAHYEAGKACFMLGRYEKAAAYANETLLLKPDFAPAYRLLAAVAEKKGDPEGSTRYTKLAQETGGISGTDKFNEAIEHVNKGEMEAAIPLLEEAVQLDPKLADAFYQLGLAYLNRGQNEKAILNLEKYLELKPDGENASTARSLLEFLKK